MVGNNAKRHFSPLLPRYEKWFPHYEKFILRCGVKYSVSSNFILYYEIIKTIC